MKKNSFHEKICSFLFMRTKLCQKSLENKGGKHIKEYKKLKVNFFANDVSKKYCEKRVATFYKNYSTS